MPIGIITKAIAGFYYVKVQANMYECKARGKFRNEDISPVVGDKVEIDISDENKKKATVVKIFDRKNYLYRPTIANVTQMVIVASIQSPKPDILMLDKQLIFATAKNITPIICINKIDLDNGNEAEILKEIYEKLGYHTLITNAKNGQGVESLKDLLKNNITVFSGNSGVGKSTLINVLFERTMMAEGDVSIKIERGRHTTKHVELFELDENSFIADTPGFSTFELEQINSKIIQECYPEFIDNIQFCRYKGCMHVKENECGIKYAVERGEIDKGRYERYSIITQAIIDKEARKYC